MSETDVRSQARALANEYLSKAEPLGWFEPLYAKAAGQSTAIPWADLKPNPNLTTWLDQYKINGAGRSAMTVGCGLGDDAEELARRGFNVTAIDISPTAINWARQRFPQSSVNYSAADLFAMPKIWSRAFDFVFEAYTLQVLPTELRKRAVGCVADLVAPNGQLLIVARAKDANSPQGTMPWPLLREEVEDFTRTGLSLISFEDFIDNDDSPVRRFRALFQRK